MTITSSGQGWEENGKLFLNINYQAKGEGKKKKQIAAYNITRDRLFRIIFIGSYPEKEYFKVRLQNRHFLLRMSCYRGDTSLFLHNFCEST